MGKELEVIRGVKGGIVKGICERELGELVDIQRRVTGRIKSLDVEGMYVEELYLVSKTAKELASTVKIVSDIERGAPESRDDEIGNMLERIMG